MNYNENYTLEEIIEKGFYDFRMLDQSSNYIAEIVLDRKIYKALFYKIAHNQYQMKGIAEQ